MIFLGLEKPVPYNGMSIFDPTMANMVLLALNNYIQAMKEDYLRGREDLKEFNKNFGDFFSPILKDMEWYELNVTGATRDFLNGLYERGIDPLRSPEARSLVSRWINNMPTGKINQLKLSAAVADKYLENMGKLMAAGRYNPDAEKFFGRDLNTWSTLGDLTNGIAANGIWGASSPIENMTMDEIIEPIIKNLDYTYDEARTKQANDGNDYYTVTEDRIRSTIADAMEDLTRDGTMPGYYYNKALQATGGDKDKAIALYTDWLTNRGKDHLKEKFTPNLYEMMRKQNEYNRSNILLQDKLARDREADKYNFLLKLQELKNQGKVGSKYGSLTGNNTYSVTEEVHYDGLYKQLKALGVKIPMLAIKDGKIVRVTDGKGNFRYRNIDEASREELLFAAAHKNILLRENSRFMGKLSKKYGQEYPRDNSAQKEYLNAYGFKISATEAASFFKDKTLSKNGGVSLSRGDLDQMLSIASIMSSTHNSGRRYSKDDRFIDIFDAANNEDGNKALKKYKEEREYVPVEWVFDSTSEKNAIQRPTKDGGTETLIKGSAKIQSGDHIIEVEQWMPIGLLSEKAVKVGNTVKATNFDLRGENRAGYRGIDSEYLKKLGQQQKVNIGLIGDSDDEDSSFLNTFQ